MHWSTPRFPVLHQLLELTQTHVHRVSDAIQPSHPLLAPFSAFSLSQLQGLFQWVGSLHQVAKVVELQLQHQSSKEYSGLISFKIDWFDLLAVQGTLKSLLQHHNLKASILWLSAFYMVQLVMCNYRLTQGSWWYTRESDHQQLLNPSTHWARSWGPQDK